MQIEYEAIFLNVDEAVLKDRLLKIGASIAKPRVLMKRVIFENEALKKTGAWVRLRDEEDKITLTLKQVTDEASITGKQEISFSVSDFQGARDFLQLLGLEERNYQENYREEWRKGEVVFDFDTWPDLPTFLEIEGVDEESVRHAAEELELDFSTACFGSVDAIYRRVLGRDILKEPRLVF